MSGFAPANAPGAYFTNMEASPGGLDPFAVFGLHADDLAITSRGLRVHHRKQVMPHVFERAAGQAATTGQMVPLWQHVNSAYELLKTRLRAEQLKWVGRSVQTWNPFAAPGSPEACVPRNSRTGTSAHMQCIRLIWLMFPLT